MGWRPTVLGREDLLPEYVRYVFNFVVALAGLIVFGVLVYGGVRYLTSVGSPTAQKDARDQIAAGFLGLAILLSSYLILTTINPQLVMLGLELQPWPELKYERPPGVYLVYTEDGEEKFSPALTADDADLKELRGKKIERVETVGPTVWDPEKGEKVPAEYKFGTILHADAGHRGRCGIYLPDGTFLGEKVDKPGSITTFRMVEKAKYGEVVLCSKPEHGGYCQIFEAKKRFENLPAELLQNVRSIKIDGPYLVVLWGNEPAPWRWVQGIRNQCRVFTSSVPDLKGDRMNICNPWPLGGLFTLWTPCATHVAVFPLLPPAGRGETPPPPGGRGKELRQ
jgi:hypothetical protein